MFVQGGALRGCLFGSLRYFERVEFDDLPTLTIRTVARSLLIRLKSGKTAPCKYTLICLAYVCMYIQSIISIERICRLM